MATMTQGFMIQSFLIPFLKKLSNEEEERPNFITYTFMSYGIGCLSYMFIALVGSFGTLSLIQASSTETQMRTLSQLEFLRISLLNGTLRLCLLYTFSIYPVSILSIFSLVSISFINTGESSSKTFKKPFEMKNRHSTAINSVSKRFIYSLLSHSVPQLLDYSTTSKN